MDGILLVDEARSGVHNMAIDQRMLETSAKTGRVLLRLYQWNEPTLTLGYFQKYANRGQHSESSELTVVRRATGGGAIVHHHDWTYAVAIPPERLPDTKGGWKTGPSQAIYDCIHHSVAAWLREFSFPARLWKKEPFDNECSAAADCSFLCFERRSPGDIVVESMKVLGSAQRRHKGSVLQHGSLLLARSQFAPSLSGLAELGNEQHFHKQKINDFGNRISTSLAEHLKCRMSVASSINDLGLGDFTDENRFALSSWTSRC